MVYQITCSTDRFSRLTNPQIYTVDQVNSKTFIENRKVSENLERLGKTVNKVNYQIHDITGYSSNSLISVRGLVKAI